MSKCITFHDAAQLPHGATDPSAEDELCLKAAKDAGVDVAKLKVDMKSEEIDKQIEDNVSLGMDVGANGTPTFIIGDNVYPGAMDYDQLKKAVG